MARMTLSGQSSGHPTSALPSGNENAATISPKVCAQRFQLHCASGATHQEVSFPRTALSSIISSRGSESIIFKVVVLQTTLPITNGLIPRDTASSFPDVPGGGF